MPIIKSAKKRVRVANKATARNRKTKRSVKNAIKTLQASISNDKKHAPELLVKAQSEIDVAIKKGVLHKNKGARKKAQLAKFAKEVNIKPASGKPKKVATTKKPLAKKATTKTTSKKVAPQKPTSKK